MSNGIVSVCLTRLTRKHTTENRTELVIDDTSMTTQSLSSSPRSRIPAAVRHSKATISCISTHHYLSLENTGSSQTSTILYSSLEQLDYHLQQRERQHHGSLAHQFTPKIKKILTCPLHIVLQYTQCAHVPISMGVSKETNSTRAPSFCQWGARQALALDMTCHHSKSNSVPGCVRLTPGQKRGDPKSHSRGFDQGLPQGSA
jgi:hypothetical protein